MGYNSVADITGLYSFAFSCYCLQKSRNDAKFRQNLTIQQFKVIQDHRSWCQSIARNFEIWIGASFSECSRACKVLSRHCTSPILCRRATVIRHGLVSARRPAALTIGYCSTDKNEIWR